ncbi:uroporphyrinogen-III synthase [Thermaurantiacus sp.]
MKAPLLLVTRPEPEASATVAAARLAGFSALAAPLLRIRPVAVPSGAARLAPDAVLMTSARSAALLRAALPGLALATPVFAVGPRTAAAARAAGFKAVSATATDGQAALDAAVAAGHRCILHARGIDHRQLRVPPAVMLAPLPLYQARAVASLPAPARRALAAGAITLLFSPRTADLFRRLVERAGLLPEGLAIVALSEAVAAAAGAGWRGIEVAHRPQTAEVLAAARRLWQGRCGGAHG